MHHTIDMSEDFQSFRRAEQGGYPGGSAGGSTASMSTTASSRPSPQEDERLRQEQARRAEQVEREREMARQDQDEDKDIHQRFKMLEKIGEGTYGSVFKAEDNITGKIVAIKKIKINYEDEGVPATAMREISLLKECDHQNVIKLHEILNSKTMLFLVFDCLDMDLRAYLKRYGPFKERLGLSRASYQCLAAIEHCHNHRILHRDLKPQNVLLDVATMRFKLADFGLARAFSVPLKVYTHEVVTLWYRAPEILLGQQRYACPTDVWSVGAIIAEMATGQALFPGDSEIDTLFRIFRLLGTPNDEVWRGVSTLRDYKTRFPNWQDTGLADVRKNGPALGDSGIALLKLCLAYDPASRPAARRLIRHDYVTKDANGMPISHP